MPVFCCQVGARLPFILSPLPPPSCPLSSPLPTLSTESEAIPKRLKVVHPYPLPAFLPVTRFTSHSYPNVPIKQSSRRTGIHRHPAPLPTLHHTSSSHCPPIPPNKSGYFFLRRSICAIFVCTTVFLVFCPLSCTHSRSAYIAARSLIW